MKFKPYTPPGGSMPVQFYAVGMKGVSIGKKKGGGVCVKAPDEFTSNRVNKDLLSRGIDLSVLSLTELLPILTNADLIGAAPRGKANYNSKFHGHQGRRGSFSENSVPKTTEDLMLESQMLDIGTAPFKVSTQKNVSVKVSSNEPVELLELLRGSKLLNVESAHLDVADVVVTNIKTGDTLFVERKTIQDMYQSVMVGAHSHDQSERMFDAVQKLKAEGKRARAIWIVEAQKGGKHLLDNALPDIKNVSGLVNYFDMVNDQSVHQSYGMEHTAYLIAKYTQGFTELRIPYPVATSNPKVNRSGKERLAAKTVDAVRVSGEAGVTRHTATDIISMLSNLPSVSTRVAKNLANLGKSFTMVTRMSTEELEAIDGVGKKTAQKIFNHFNAELKKP